MKLWITLGDALFAPKDSSDWYFMAEGVDLASHYTYHKLKLVLFFSAMRAFSDSLDKTKLTYIQFDKQRRFFDALLEVIVAKRIKNISLYEIDDVFFEKEFIAFCTDNQLEYTFYPSPKFLLSVDEFVNYRRGRTPMLFNDFYIWMRKTEKILLDESGLPLGGQWNFDSENRKKIPKSLEIPKFDFKSMNPHVPQVIDCVTKFCPENPGELSHIWFATTRSEALDFAKQYFQERFVNFGLYQDAIVAGEPFMFHSCLSYALNMGLLTPKEVIRMALQSEAQLSAKEGFIRQILGWREFVRGMYRTGYTELDVVPNYWKHSRKLAQCWYDATTGIEPVDSAILSVIKYGYTHHIERLMILGNMMLLCEIDSKEVYAWFMELFIDSADWVMVANVYGMSQYADGGVFATKPYICGSAYVLKMSHYGKDEWCDVWDGLYWRFIDKHKEVFAKNHRMSMMVSLLQKKKSDVDNFKYLMKSANAFIEQVTK
jgi:deoxyribodipyrimidine photolyase-related protein